MVESQFRRRLECMLVNLLICVLRIATQVNDTGGKSNLNRLVTSDKKIAIQTYREFEQVAATTNGSWDKAGYNTGEKDTQKDQLLMFQVKLLFIVVSHLKYFATVTDNSNAFDLAKTVVRWLYVITW